MNRIGDIILIPFPYSQLTQVKIRPAMVICSTKDKYKDLVVAAISSQLPAFLQQNDIMIVPDMINQLRKKSVLKVDRIFTLKKENSIALLGKLSLEDLQLFRQKFIALIN